MTHRSSTTSSPSQAPDSGPALPPEANRELHRIGWKEVVDLPGLGITGLKAKIDTGARTSALHVENLRVVTSGEDGLEFLSFDVPLDRTGSRRVATRARCLRRIRVTDSGGHGEERPMIETDLVLGPVRKTIRLTLTSRRGMLFRMLLGRKSLEDTFLVDVGKKYLLGGTPGQRTSGERGKP